MELTPESIAVDTHGHTFFDAEDRIKLHDPFRYPVKKWRVTTIGKLLSRPHTRRKDGVFVIGIAKDAELAFYIKNNIAGVKDDTVCLIGNHYRGRAIKIYDTEYRQREGLLYEKKT